MKITNRVRVLRKELGLRQEDLAKLAGVSRQTIIAMENEKYSPSLELAMSLSQLLSRPVEDIFQSLPDESD